MRRKIIAGNWKMNKTRAEAGVFIEEIKSVAGDRGDVDIVVCPPYTALDSARTAVHGSRIALGAQDMFWKERGAYTGRISPAMLLDLEVQYVIVGHSETRGRFGVPEPDMDDDILRHFGDTDASVNRKLRAALEAGIVPICCVGETLAERRDGRTDSVLVGQTERALVRVDSDQTRELMFAYEPVWAIGTAEVCEAPEADRVCGLIRETATRILGRDAEIRVQYGGSVKPDNAADLLERSNIDGALVGGASLKSPDFAAIIRACPHG